MQPFLDHTSVDNRLEPENSSPVLNEDTRCFCRAALADVAPRAGDQAGNIGLMAEAEGTTQVARLWCTGTRVQQTTEVSPNAVVVHWLT